MLFEPLVLRKLTIPNRAWVSPMCQYSVENRDGVPTDWHKVHYGSLAVGRFGMVLTEVTSITPEGRISPNDVGLWNDEQQQAWASIVAFIKSQGVVPGIQIGHAGRKASTHREWDEKSGSVSEEDGGWTTLAPSAVAMPGLAEPREMTVDEIHALVAAFGNTARRAVEAGFEVVELHAAHGYLLHQFLSPLSNFREDEYGGSLENRARFLRESVAAVRDAIGPDVPLMIRVSATDWLDGGLTTEDVAQVAGSLDEVDFVDVSTGGLLVAKIPVGPSYQVFAARDVARMSGKPVSCVGIITDPAQAEGVLADRTGGPIQAVMLARMALSDPRWLLHAARALHIHDAEQAWPVQYRRAARF